MVPESIILFTGLVTIISIISAVLSIVIERMKSLEDNKRMLALRKIAGQIEHSPYIKKLTNISESSSHLLPQQQIIDLVENRIMNKLEMKSHMTEERIRIDTDNYLNDLIERVENIERRFPDESKIEKIASINDALLSERIDQLKEQFDRLDGKLLTKWDIAVIVSTIIGGISAIVAMTYGFLKFIGKV